MDRESIGEPFSCILTTFSGPLYIFSESRKASRLKVGGKVPDDRDRIGGGFVWGCFASAECIWPSNNIGSAYNRLTSRHKVGLASLPSGSQHHHRGIEPLTRDQTT